MPKFKNPQAKKQQHKKEELQRLKDKYAFRSVVLSAVIGSLLLVVSFFLNGTSWFLEGIFVSNFVEKELLWEILDNTIKVTVIILTFYFFMLSLGNYKELTGKPVEVKELALLITLSLIQTIRNIWVFIFTMVFLSLIIFYLYLTQERS